MVAPIGAVGAGTTVGLVQDAQRAARTAQSQATEATGTGFGQLVSNGLHSVSNLEHAADAAVQDLASGGSTRIEDVMVATSQAQLGIELLSRVRDRALEAYQEVMRMPL